MLTLRIITTASVANLILNLTASSPVLVGLSVSFNLAAALIQMF